LACILRHGETRSVRNAVTGYPCGAPAETIRWNYNEYGPSHPQSFSDKELSLFRAANMLEHCIGMRDIEGLI
jgi:hypothetical protein